MGAEENILLVASRVAENSVISIKFDTQL